MRFGIIIFLLLPLIGQCYVSYHVWKLLPLSFGWKCSAVVLMALAFVSLFSLIVIMREHHLPTAVATFLYEVGTSWIVILLYLFMLFASLDLLKLIHVIPSQWLSASWVGTLVIMSAIVAIFVYGNIHYRHKVRQPLTYSTDKAIGSTKKIVFLSDIHAGYHNRRGEIARWIDLVNAEHPDIVLIAGDIIDISVEPLYEQDMASEFRRIEAPIYACLGNHEYFSGDTLVARFFKESGINLLRDSVVIKDGIAIVGRDDRSNRHRKPLSKLMEQVPVSTYSIVLDHQPYRLDEAESCGVDLQLSGHTHHGQVWPLNWITEAIYEVAFGEYRRGNTRYYVSSGMGIWGGKFRIGTRSEFIVLTISN